MQELVSRSLHSVHFDRHDILEDLLHHVLLLSIRAEAHLRLEVATFTSAYSHFVYVCRLERGHISRLRSRPICLAVIKVEEA